MIILMKKWFEDEDQHIHPGSLPGIPHHWTHSNQPLSPGSSELLPPPAPQGNLNLNSTLPLSLLPVAEKINPTLPR